MGSDPQSHVEKGRSLQTPIRNLVHHPNEILCHAQNDNASSLRAPTRNLVYHPNEILCHAQYDRGQDDEILHQVRNDNPISDG